MINTVLIANSGEIVRRVERACETLGCGRSPCYSDPMPGASYVDKRGGHPIGEANPVKSYLNVDAP